MLRRNCCVDCDTSSQRPTGTGHRHQRGHCPGLGEVRRVVAVEGNALHHCVGTYGKKHANGSTAIFFIRRASRPNEPWYTLELDEKKLEVRQNRGKHNCARVPEVQAFENKWLAWVWAGAPRGQDGKPVLPQARVRAA